MTDSAWLGYRETPSTYAASNRAEDRAADADYLLAHGANLIQAMAWCASYPRGRSPKSAMDDYLRGNDW